MNGGNVEIKEKYMVEVVAKGMTECSYFCQHNLVSFPISGGVSFIMM